MKKELHTEGPKPRDGLAIRRVLIIDDDETMNRAMSTLIQWMGHGVGYALTLKEGFKRRLPKIGTEGWRFNPKVPGDGTWTVLEPAANRAVRWVRVKSDGENLGSTFSFVIPVDAEMAQSQEREKEAVEVQ